MMSMALLLFLVLPHSTSAINITRKMPAKVDMGMIFSTNITINTQNVGVLSSYTESIPAGFLFNSWRISGTKEGANNILVNVRGRDYTWNFTPTASTVSLSYYATAPPDEGNYTFTGLVSDGTNRASDNFLLLVQKMGCGNGLCEANENSSSCPQDCGAGSAGNGNLVSGPSTVTGVQTVTTTTSTAGATPEDLLAHKNGGKSSKTLIIIIISTVIVLGFTIYGLYMQMQKKKGGVRGAGSAASGPAEPKFSFLKKGTDAGSRIVSGLKESVEKLASKSRESEEREEEASKREYAEAKSSELPSFNEPQAKFEIPSMPMEARKNQNIVLSIPPIPKRQQRPQRPKLAPMRRMENGNPDVRVARPGMQATGKPAAPIQQKKAQPAAGQAANEKGKEPAFQKESKDLMQEDIDNALDNIMGKGKK